MNEIPCELVSDSVIWHFENKITKKKPYWWLRQSEMLYGLWCEFIDREWDE